MTTPLDEKGLEAAEAAWHQSDMGLRWKLSDAIRAYLSTTPAPDGLEELQRYNIHLAEDDPTSFHGMELAHDGEWVRADQAQSALAAASKERDREMARCEFTQQWYAERLRKIEDVAKREGLWPEVAAIIGNGSGTRQMPDGSFVYDPPTYAQQLNSAKHRAETAEAEVKRLTEANEALMSERKNLIETKRQQIACLEDQAREDQREHAKLHSAAEARIKALEEALQEAADEFDGTVTGAERMQAICRAAAGRR